MTPVIALGVLIVAMVMGIPIPLSFLVSAAFICLVGGYNPLMLFTYGFNNQNSIILLTIPLFILAGAIIDKGGIGEKLISGLQRKGKDASPNGLGITTILACAIFGAVSGSAAATCSCIGSIMTPRLKKAGYKAGHIGALISSSGVLSIMIPPSILMILYAWGTGTSVLACFLSTILPGIMLVILFSIINAWMLKHDKMYKDNAPASAASEQALQNMIAQGQRKEAERAIRAAGPKQKSKSPIPAVLMPILLLGSIYGGILTTTEGAALSVVYSLLIGIFYYRTIDWPTFKVSMRQAGEAAGTIMVMLFTVSIISRLYVTENLPDLILGFMTSVSENRIIILLMINVFMVIIGMLMDDCSGTVLCGPILLPIVAALGVTPIQFAAILSVNLGMGNITPPTAPLLYLGGRVANAEVKDMLGPMFKLIFFGWIPTLIITTYFADFALFIPRLLGYVS